MLVINHSDSQKESPFIDGTYTYQILEAKNDGGSKRLAINGSEDGPAFGFHKTIITIQKKRSNPTERGAPLYFVNM